MPRILLIVAVLTVVVVGLSSGCSDDAVTTGSSTTAERSTSTVPSCDQKVKVYAVVERIPKGTMGDVAFANGWIALQEIAPQYRPSTAVLRPDLIAGHAAISDLEANQVVVGDQFGVTVPVVSNACDLSSTDASTTVTGGG